MYLEHTKIVLLALVLLILMLTGYRPRKGLPTQGQIPTEPLPAGLKGYELYSWQVDREWYFTLSSEANRAKTVQEITSGENDIGNDRVKVTVQGVHDVEVIMERLPPDARVAWVGPQAIKRQGSKPGALALPSRRVVEDIKAHCDEQGVRLEVSK